ncbi:MAG: hypothetical protein JNK15_01600, partial [Planctomycetes bacterium]|nr:hypothetical protein [Planctomycetota bacterium]
NSDSKPASTRDAPRDRVATGATRTDAARAPVRVTSPSGSAATPIARTPNTNVALSPRAGAPRLGSASTTAPGARGITSGVVGQRSYGHGHGDPYGHCHTNSYWRGYWDPCHSAWNHCGSNWVIGSWCGSFGWRLSFYYPFWTWRSHCWTSCYHDTLWCSWYQPHCVATNYWWYPSSAYCPSYLYVPSTVVYYETAAAAPAEGGASSEVVVAGSSVVGSARAREVGPGSEDVTRSLAAKYVELGDFYFRAARFHDAAEAYAKARSYAPDDASVHFVLADAVFAEGDWHYAAFLIEEGLRLDPTLASADTDKRSFYGDPAAFDAQMAALQSYLDRNDYDAQAWLVRGYNLAFSRNADGAVVAFERVRAIAPENRAAQLFLAALRPAPAAERTSY